MLLLITERPIITTTLTEWLNSHDIFFYRTPLETAMFNIDKRDTGGVLLDCTSDFKKAEAFCHTLRQRYPEMPIGVLVAKNDIPNLPADMILRDGNLTSICENVAEFCRLCGWLEHPLRQHSLFVGKPSELIYYMGYPLPLSAREYKILRCLFYRTPRVTDADELMSLCYVGGTQKIDNLSVQISNINRHACKIDPRPLIVNVYGQGYRLRDGL